jgi:hypothetical protein
MQRHVRLFSALLIVLLGAAAVVAAQPEETPPYQLPLVKLTDDLETTAPPRLVYQKALVQLTGDIDTQPQPKPIIPDVPLVKLTDDLETTAPPRLVYQKALVQFTGDIDTQPQPKPIIPDVPLVKLTDDLETTAPLRLVYQKALVQFTGDIDTQPQFESEIVYALPLVRLTGDIHYNAPRYPPLLVRTQPVLIGDPDLPILKLVTNFATNHEPALLAPNAELIDLTQGQIISGRSAISEWMATYYSGQGLLRATYEEPLRVIVPDDHTVIYETLFHGTALRRDGSLLKALREPITVEVPMITWFEVADGEIVRQSVYYDIEHMLGPLGLR